MGWLQELGLQECFEHLAYVYAGILTPALMVIWQVLLAQRD